MILIATDEAGYGPKLGPLVVTASAWKLAGNPDNVQDLKDAFAVVSKPVIFGGQRIVVNDSKAVFQPKSAGKNSSGYGKLEAVTLAGCRWCGLITDRLDIIPDLAARDQIAIRETPWLKGLAEQSIEIGYADSLITAWRSGIARLVAVKARVITAERFNRCCASGLNKSDLLSQTTLELVKNLLDNVFIEPDEAVWVFCDRHGGRRYYAGPLQSVFNGMLVGVIAESKTESSYCVPYNDREFTIRFTVKGDSFTPVAFSSMVAKYIREKAMESLNAYFARLHTASSELRPTAGYPVDADRFLTEIRPIIEKEKIDIETLVRSR